MKSIFIYRKGALGDTLAFIPFLFTLSRCYRKIYFAGNYLYRELFEGIDFIEYLDADSRPVFEMLTSHHDDFPLSADRALIFSREPLCKRSNMEYYEPLPRDTWVYEHPFKATGVAFDARRLYLPINFDAGSAAVPGKPYSVIHPGSGGKTKRWAVNNFFYVGDRLEEMGVPVVYLTGEADGDILPQLGNRCHEHNSSFKKLIYLLAYSSCYLGCDSGVSHLAGLLNLTGWALFGPSSPEIYRPWGGIEPVCGDDGDVNRISRGKILDLVGERIAKTRDIYRI